MSNDSHFNPTGGDEQPSPGLDSLQDLPVDPEEMSYFVRGVRNAIDVAILHSMGFELSEIPKSEADLRFEEEATEKFASWHKDPQARERFVARRNAQRKTTTQHWPLDSFKAELMLLDRAVAKEPGLESPEPSLDMVYLDVEDISVKLDNPLWYGYDDTAVINGLRIDRHFDTSNFEIYVKTGGGYEIAYLFDGQLDGYLHELGSMLDADVMGYSYNLAGTRHLTLPGEAEEDAVNDEISSDQLVVSDEEALVLAAFSKTVTNDMWVPSPDELIRLSRAVDRVVTEGKLAGKVKLTVGLDSKSGIHEVEL